MITPPTPAMTPSITSERRMPSGITDSASAAVHSTHPETRSISGEASQKIELKIASMVRAKTTVPSTRCVNIASIRSPSERIC